NASHRSPGGPSHGRAVWTCREIKPVSRARWAGADLPCPAPNGRFFYPAPLPSKGDVMAIDWYREFVDLDHTPGPDELVALYYFEPAAGISREEAVGRIASESSTGTWTTLFTLPPRMRALQAKAFEIEGNYVKIAYPLALWEEGNAAQLLSGIAGNVFGMKALESLRLIDA